MGMKKYRLKQGAKLFLREGKGSGIVKKVGGDEVLLTDAQFEKHKHRLESIVVPEAPSETPPPPVKKDEAPPKLRLVQVGPNKYNVVNEATKKAINDKALTKEEAESLLSGEEEKSE